VTQFQGSHAIWDISSILVTGIAADLAASENGPVERACVVPGEIAWDECNCGLLAVTARRFFLSDNFPETSLGVGLIRTSPCDLPWLVAELAVQVIRCVPTSHDDGTPPTCVALGDAARVLMVDAYVALTTTVSILCGMTDADEIIDYVIGEQVSRGPEGDCVGTELNVFVGVMR
jgi:hypothetical protein